MLPGLPFYGIISSFEIDKLSLMRYNFHIKCEIYRIKEGLYETQIWFVGFFLSHRSVGILDA